MKHLRNFFLILSAVIMIAQPVVFAINDPPGPGDCIPSGGEGYNALLRGSSWHNICKPCAPEAADTSSDVNISGKGVKAAFQFLISTPWKTGANQNWTAAQAAGIVANGIAESNLRPEAVNGIGATGLFQWYKGRAVQMKAWVSAKYGTWKSFEGQMAFLQYELNHSQTGPRNATHATSTPEEAADKFNHEFEVSGDYGNHRPNLARGVYNKYKDLAPAAASISTGATGAPCSDVSDVNCGVETGVAKILCAAKRYAGIYYRWGGGHDGVAHFHKVCPDPTNPPNNHPHGSPRNPANGNLSGNPSPCAVDCSGLVIQAVYDAFKVDLGGGGVHLLMGNSKYWKKISLSEARPGDVVTPSDLAHIEIVVKHLSGKRFETFGAHRTGTKTGPATGSYDNAYHYVGPGGNTAL